jgi:hypothetical protein
MGPPSVHRKGSHGISPSPSLKAYHPCTETKEDIFLPTSLADASMTGGPRTYTKTAPSGLKGGFPYCAWVCTHVA